MSFVVIICTDLHCKIVKCVIISYADYVTIFRADQESVKKATEVTFLFYEHTCSAVNWQTPLGFWHSELPSTPIVFDCVVWSDIPACYLGVSLEQYHANNEYWSEETRALRAKTDKWGGTGLLIFARATV